MYILYAYDSNRYDVLIYYIIILVYVIDILLNYIIYNIYHII